MDRLKSYLAKKPGIVIAFGLAGLGSSFSAGLNLAHGNDEMLLAEYLRFYSYLGGKRTCDSKRIK